MSKPWYKPACVTAVYVPFAITFGEECEMSLIVSFVMCTILVFIFPFKLCIPATYSVFILRNPVTYFPFQIIYSCYLICHSYYVFLLFVFPFKWCVPVTYSIPQIMYSCYLFYLCNYALVLLILSFVLCPPVLNPWNKTFSVSSTVYTQYSKVFWLFKEAIIRISL